MSVDAIPPNGGLKDALKFLQNPQMIKEQYQKAEKWVYAAIQLIKQAPGGDEIGNDEEIATKILEKIKPRTK